MNRERGVDVCCYLLKEGKEREELQIGAKSLKLKVGATKINSPYRYRDGPLITLWWVELLTLRRAMIECSAEVLTEALASWLSCESCLLNLPTL